MDIQAIKHSLNALQVNGKSIFADKAFMEKHKFDESLQLLIRVNNQIADGVKTEKADEEINRLLIGNFTVMGDIALENRSDTGEANTKAEAKIQEALGKVQGLMGQYNPNSKAQEKSGFLEGLWAAIKSLIADLAKGIANAISNPFSKGNPPGQAATRERPSTAEQEPVSLEPPPALATDAEQIQHPEKPVEGAAAVTPGVDSAAPTDEATPSERRDSTSKKL